MSNPVVALNNNTPTGSGSNVNRDGSVKTVPAGGAQLTQADFLKIMVAQFTQQDPLASGGDGSSSSGTNDYVNELMAMTNLTTIQTMSGQQAQQLAATLPGEQVEIDDNGTFTSGTVQIARVDSSTGGVYFTVNGNEYPLSDLYAIAPPAAASTGTGTDTGTNSTPNTGSTTPPVVSN